MATAPDPTTGALGGIYSTLGDMTLGTDYLGRVVNAEVEIQLTLTRTVDAEVGIGVRLTRTITNVLAVSRPPSRTIPGVIATQFARSHTISGVVATQFSRDRTIPGVVAVSVTASRTIPGFLAVSRAVSPAILAPRRGGLMQILLDTLNPLYDLDPEAVTMLSIEEPVTTVGGTPWRVSGNLFEIVGLPTTTPVTPTGTPQDTIPGRTDAVYSGVPVPQDFASGSSGTPNPGTGVAPYTRDLRTLTIGTLASELTAAGYPSTATADYAALAATTLCDSHGDASVSLGGVVTGFTSVLWRVYRALALGFELVQDDLVALAEQLDLRRASGIWLDWWGSLYAVPRLAPEDDARYRKRIVWSVTRPRANNTAIESILRDLFETTIYVFDRYPIGVSRGDPYTPTAIDRTFSPTQTLMGTYFPGYHPRFVVAIPPDADDTTAEQIAAVTETLRAAGVRFQVIRYTATTRTLSAQVEIG